MTPQNGISNVQLRQARPATLLPSPGEAEPNPLMTHFGKRFSRTNVMAIATAAPLALWLAVVAAPACAQQPAAPNPMQMGAIRHLQSDLFLEEGVGFKRVRIGHSFQQVAQTWGSPQSMRRSLLGFSKKWQYRLNQSIVITVAGGKRVVSITVLGGITTPFGTTEGARFGMTRAQIASIYGEAPGKQSNSSLSYPGRGVVFVFKNGLLHAITITAPKHS